MLDLYETFADTSDGCSIPSDTISRSIKNAHDLLDSRQRVGGQGKSGHGSESSNYQDKTDYQTFSLIVEPNCYKTKQTILENSLRMLNVSTIDLLKEVSFIFLT